MKYLNQKMNKSFMFLLMCWLLLCVTGCSIFSNNENDKSLEVNEEITVLTPQSEKLFYQVYGNSLLTEFPNLSFNIVTTNNDSYYNEDSFFDENNSDLVISYSTTFKDLMGNQRLLDLSQNISESKIIKLEDYYDQMKIILSDETGSQYGLAPLLSVSSIFYNKSLFDSYGVDYPTGSMSWDGILSLAERFDSSQIKGEVYGFEGGEAGLSNLLMTVMANNKLKMWDQQNQNLLIDEVIWTEWIERVINLSNKGVLKEGIGESFLSGNAAILSFNLSLIPQLIQNDAFDWGVVSYPVDPSIRSLNSGLIFNHVFSINSQSSKKDTTWKVIEYLMSEESVKHLQENDYIGSISTLKTHMNSYSGVDVESLINFEMDNRKGYYDQLESDEYWNKFSVLLSNTLQDALNNQWDSDEIINKLKEGSKFIEVKESSL